MSSTLGTFPDGEGRESNVWRDYDKKAQIPSSLENHFIIIILGAF